MEQRRSCGRRGAVLPCVGPAVGRQAGRAGGLAGDALLQGPVAAVCQGLTSLHDGQDVGEGGECWREGKLEGEGNAGRRDL